VPNREELGAMSAARAEAVFPEEAASEIETAVHTENRQEFARRTVEELRGIPGGRVFVQTDNGEIREIGRPELVFGIDFASVDETREMTTVVRGTHAPDGATHIREIEQVPTIRGTRPDVTVTEHGQLLILPEVRPVGRDMIIPVSMLDIPIETPPPEPDLVNSMRMLGCFSSITVRETAHRRFEVFGGRRRALAARIVGLNQVTAIAYPPSTPRHVMAAMTMAENNVRRANPLAELEAIETMLRVTGATEQTIATELMLPISVVRKRIGLTRLIPPLRVGLVDGRIFPNVAELAARLTNEQQIELAETLQSRERLEGRARNLRAADVRAVRSAGLQEGAQGDLVDEIVTDTGYVTAEITRADDEGHPLQLDYQNEAFVRSDLSTSLEDQRPWILQDGRRFVMTDLNPDGTPRDQFLVGDENGVYPTHGEVERGRATRFLPEVWMREQIAMSRAAVEAIDEGQLRYHGQLYLSADRAEEVVRRGVADAMTRHGEQRELVVGGRRFIRADQVEPTQRAMNEALMRTAEGFAAVAHPPEVVEDLTRLRAQIVELQRVNTYDESWGSVDRLLRRALDVMPVAPDGNSDVAYHALEEVLALATRHARVEARRPGNLETMVQGLGGPNADAQFAGMTTDQVAETIMIRGGYREYEREGDRHFQRYVDSNGRLRRRTLPPAMWEARVREAFANSQVTTGGVRV
jgi:ParB/RepB/Spo0J family partition protein